MKNPRYANPEGIGFLVEYNTPGQPLLYVDSGSLYDDILAGKFGQIAPYSQPAPDPDTRTLADVAAAKQEEIRDKSDAFLADLAAEYGAYEKLTWDQQAAESDALALDPDAAAPLVRSIAASRNMDALALAARIRANRAQWVLLSGSIVGQRLAYQDALDAAQTVEEVDAIVPVYSVG